MPNDPSREKAAEGQSSDALAELEAKDPAVHSAKHHRARPIADTSEADNEQPAKDIDTVRGHDTPQPLRHSS